MTPRSVCFRLQTVGSSANPHDVLQTDLDVLNGLCAMFQHGAIPTTVTQRCSLTFQTHTLTYTFISISFPFALSTKTCLTRKHYSTESKCFWRQANGNVWKRLFLFSFFSPPLMCAVVDHVECTSIWWKVASASCCVPFLKKTFVFFLGGGIPPLNLATTSPFVRGAIDPHCPTLSIQSSCL